MRFPSRFHAIAASLALFSDPIATLMFLFLGNAEVLPAPHGAPGEDPTPDDGLGCRGR